MKKELTRFISYGAELTRTRFYQEAYLAALLAAMTSQPKAPTETAEAFARRVVALASDVADAAFNNHGPSVSEHLQTEAPFVAAAGVKDDEPQSNDPESDGY